MASVLFTGSFDPITKGHMNIIDQASALFGEVVIAVLQNSSKKNGFFTLEERVELVKKIYEKRDDIKVVSENKLAIDIAILNECKAIIRGIRNSKDADEEIQLSQINKELSEGKINTICLLADKDYQFISSSMVREVFKYGKDISKYVEPVVEEAMKIKSKRL